MVLGTQRTIEATDLWELEPSFASAELLSDRLQTIWERRQAEAAAYNTRLDNGKVKAGLWPRLKWAVGRGQSARALASGRVSSGPAMSSSAASARRRARPSPTSL
jgi:hypothetical protein